MFNELIQAAEPFLNAAQETLPENASVEVEVFNQLPPIEVDTRLVVPANTNLRNIVRTGTISFSVAPTTEESGQGPLFAQREDWGGQSESTEDSFEVGVLLEPWPVNHNVGLESSMINQIRAMENANSPFLLDKEKRVYWSEIKEALDNCSSQKDYNRFVEFANRDHQIRERKQDTYGIFEEMLAQNPTLAENAAYNPHECFIDFLNEMREELDEEGGDVLVRDQKEMAFLHGLGQDLRRAGSNSSYIKRILGTG
ncbi:cytochrome c oxidase subunit 2 [Striga asiatica]|uniref:Cytochrome c oxidase subunit 2 n=1 Tax=Striga asiatica TaxID=4170 RepID=A0A5A7QQS7_STRAF|nr:cytochrome c oxidase subunit 2 [Striga asiatica]